MQDFVKGSPRTRAWPRKRGPGGTKAQRDNRAKFMNAQRATKYFSSTMYQWFMKQVAGSPLLPRDVMTMMLYNRLYVFDLDDGRSLWPMPSIYDVSESLDVIAKIPGQTIVRGPANWEPVQAPGPQLATRFTVLHDEVIAAATPNIIVNNLASWNEIWCQCFQITASGSGLRRIQVSVDNGINFFTGGGDYGNITAGGGSSTTSQRAFHNVASAAARTGFIQIVGKNTGTPAMMLNPSTDLEPHWFLGSPLEINAVRISNSTGGNLTGGRFIVMAR